MSMSEGPCYISDSDEEGADGFNQKETLSTMDDTEEIQKRSDKRQIALDGETLTLPTPSIDHLPNEVLIMILKNLDPKEQNACRLLNWRFRDLINGHFTSYDKPKNCTYSKKDKSLYIGELESEEEVVALLKKIKYPTQLTSVVIDWKELKGDSPFNDSFLFGAAFSQFGYKYVLNVTLKVQKVGERKPVIVGTPFEVKELTLDIKKGLDAESAEELLRQFCLYADDIFPSTLHIPNAPFTPFIEAVKQIDRKYLFALRSGHSMQQILATPYLSVVLKPGDDFSEIIVGAKEKYLTLTHLDVTISDAEQVNNFRKIFQKHAKNLKSFRITMSSAARTTDKPSMIVWPIMNSLEKLEVIVFGSGEDAEGNLLPPLIKFRYKNDFENERCVKKTFPKLKRLCIRPPVATDEEKWDAIYRAYYANFVFVRKPDEDHPLAKWNRYFESLELSFPPKMDEVKFGGDKYQRFCLELTKMFDVDKAVDANSGEEVSFYRFK